jgi:ribose transport system substrate-binding protein
MKPQQRRDKLLRIIRSNPNVSTSQLAEMVGTAHETVRNDLVNFEKRGVLRRQRGRMELMQTDEAFQVLRKSGALSREERRSEILNILRDHPNLRTRPLSPIFNVSEGTIRNDLIALEKAGNIQRKYGEIVLLNSADRRALLSPAHEFSDSVRYICDRALSLVEAGDQIFLDDSLCAEYIALNLPMEGEIRVVTNSLKTAATLTWRGYQSDVFILPGLLQTESTSIDVQLRETVSERLFVTKAFFCISAANSESGFFVDSLAQFDLFSLMIRISECYYVLLESGNAHGRDHYGFPVYDHLAKLGEVIIDNVHPLKADGLFSADLPVTICGDNVVLKSPFNKQYIIGFSTLDGSHEFSQIVRKSIEEAAGEYTSVELVITDNRMDPRITLSNVETFINNNVDLVIEYSQDYQLGPLIAEKLSQSGIPLLAVDIPIPGAVYFGANNYQAGRLAGEAAAKEVARRWDGRLDALIVFTERAAGPTIENRIAGMLEAFLEAIEFDEQEIISIDARNEVRDSAEKLAPIMRSLDPATRTVIFSFNAVATIGILESLKSVEMDRSSIVVSHNYMQSTAREMGRVDSPLLGTVTFNPEQYGKNIMEIALRMLGKEPVQQLNFTEHRWVGRDNPV